jgi:hypothetical protein
MKTIKTILISTFLLTATFSCSDNIGISGGGGREGEVVVVLNEDFQKGQAGEIVNQFLLDSYLLLPQHEPKFKLYVIPWNAFTNTFKGFRNIVRIDIDPKYTESNAKLQQNKSQTVINLSAPNSEAFVELFKKHGEQIVTALSLSEKLFAKEHIRKGVDKQLQKHLREKHNIEMNIPKGYQIRKDTSDFVYLSLETKELTLGIVIYYYPYTNPNVFSAGNLLSKRDSLLQRHVKGPLYPEKISYMTTLREPVAPLFRETKIENAYAAEIRGLWNITDDFMAGPFLSISRVDEERNRVVTVEGFVYYPSEKKRKYMRWFEVILEDVKFPGKEK